MSITHTAALAVDVGHSYLKIVQTSANGNIEKYSICKMPEGCIDGLTIVYEDALVQLLKKVRKTDRFNGAKCTLVVSGSDIITRQYIIPMLSDELMYQNIMHEIGGYLPSEPEKYYVDYKIAGITEQEGVKMYRVLVSSVQKRIIDRYIKAFKSSGLTINIVDTCENACEKLLSLKRQNDSRFPLDNGICFLDIGNKHTHVSLYDNGTFFASHLLKRSGQNIIEAISKAIGSEAAANELVNQKENYLNALQKSDALKDAVAYELNALLFEVSRVLDFYRNKTKRPVGCIYTLGGGALLPGIDEYIEKNLGIHVHSAAGFIASVEASKTPLLLNAYAATLRENTK